jgi:type I restriction enzyme R subunit
MNKRPSVAERSGNFDFLAKYDDRVAHLAQQAEMYVHSDPDSALFKLRLMVETMARTLIEMQMPQLVDADLSVMLRSLQRSGLLTRREADDMHAIRRDGNAAVHGYDSTTPTAMRRLRDAWRLSRWYARIVKRGAKVKASDFKPPLPPAEDASQRAVRQRAEALEEAVEARRSRTREALLLFGDQDDITAMRWRLRGELRALEGVAAAAGEPIVDADFVALVMAMDLEQILEHPAWGRSSQDAKAHVEAQFEAFKVAHSQAEQAYLKQRAELAREARRGI